MASRLSMAMRRTFTLLLLCQSRDDLINLNRSMPLRYVRRCTSQLLAVVNQIGVPDPLAGQLDPNLGNKDLERGVTRRGPLRSSAQEHWLRCRGRRSSTGRTWACVQ